MTSTDRSVTVVIPTLNRARLLRTTLWSVLRQTHAAEAVIVVDDGSTDDTHQMLSSVPTRLATLRHARPWGVSAARNHALERVRTEWVAFLDDDDVWAPWHLEHLLRQIDEAEADGRQADLAYVGRLITDSARRVTAVRTASPAEDLHERLRSRNALGPPSAVLLRTACVREVGGFDERLSLHADWDLWLKVVRPDRIARSETQTLGYMVHGSNMHLIGELALDELHLLEAAGVVPKARYVAECHRRANHQLRALGWHFRAWRQEGDVPHLRRAAWRLVRRTSDPTPRPDIEAPWLSEVARVDAIALEETPWPPAACSDAIPKPGEDRRGNGLVGSDAPAAYTVRE